MQALATWMPRLSEEDPAEPAEGPLDPLGMYPIADALGGRLVPGVRERQSRPRFLTLLAVSQSLSQEFFEHPPHLPPWLVFEWYVVDALCRAFAGEADAYLPGRRKAEAALRDGMALCASRYLKTPSVFGFHGIYRVLAKELRICHDDVLGQHGYELLCAWERDQGLEGFATGGGGPGQAFRRMLVDAVRKGMEQEQVAHGKNWEGWALIQRHLRHHSPGPRERTLLQRLLLDDSSGHRRALIEFLTSQRGRDIAAEGGDTLPQRKLHSALHETTDHDGLRQLLEVISKYETFARLLQHAFEDVLFLMSHNQLHFAAASAAHLASVQQASARVPGLYEELVSLLMPYGEAIRFNEAFGGLAGASTPAEFPRVVLEHHRRVQRNKPPHGKRAWIETDDGGRYVIRPEYRRHEPPPDTTEYVHFYRMSALLSFARDLEMLA